MLVVGEDRVLVAVGAIHVVVDRGTEHRWVHVDAPGAGGLTHEVLVLVALEAGLEFSSPRRSSAEDQYEDESESGHGRWDPSDDPGTG